jgi:hypothetical protein
MADIARKDMIPDARREYLVHMLDIETNPDAKLVYEALLHGYDRGELIMRWDPWQQEMQYSAAEVH